MRESQTSRIFWQIKRGGMRGKKAIMEDPRVSVSANGHLEKTSTEMGEGWGRISSGGKISGQFLTYWICSGLLGIQMKMLDVHSAVQEWEWGQGERQTTGVINIYMVLKVRHLPEITRGEQVQQVEKRTRVESWGTPMLRVWGRRGRKHKGAWEGGSNEVEGKPESVVSWKSESVLNV